MSIAWTVVPLTGDLHPTSTCPCRAYTEASSETRCARCLCQPLGRTRNTNDETCRVSENQRDQLRHVAPSRDLVVAGHQPNTLECFAGRARTHDLFISQLVAGKAATPCTRERPFTPRKSGWAGRFAAGLSPCFGQPRRSAARLPGMVNAIILSITNAATERMCAKIQGEAIASPQ